ncbi:hypothetical protein [Lutispora thermophila]|uniref:hypothetical protein n=1 Tax=Lutispora thermophila TaxID=288966 RepID=UPI00158736EF|nr:hypothetical protein [Lutispora thermophila]
MDSYDKSMKSLQNKLLVTAIGKEKRLNHIWGSYLWGTSDTWEKEYSRKYEFENPKEFV